MDHSDGPSVAVVGGGVAGLTAGMFAARHGLDTVVFDSGDSILRRNAHLENFPGFPLGVNARHFLELLQEQVERSGCSITTSRVSTVRRSDERFRIESDGDPAQQADVVIAATKNETSPFEELPGVEIVDRGKRFIVVDDRGRTDLAGFYAAGRLAGEPHQAIVAAGHGAKVAVTVLDDLDAPFYHDWVVPERYFTGRDRKVPPGCEEIDDRERTGRERRANEYMGEQFDDPPSDPPRQHPSVAEPEEST